MPKIAVIGAGYVGLSLATLLSQNNEVVLVDIVSEKVDKINNRISPIKDKYIEEYFQMKDLRLKATLDYEEALKDAQYVIISTPTNYDEEKGFFDTSSVEEVIKKIKEMDLDTTILIKSTVPVGFTSNVREKYKMDNIIFSPEFLREGNALYDNLYPSRIIIGEKSKKAEELAKLLTEGALKKDIIVKFMNSSEAEAVKLFANTYLALRVAYFNELDTYSEMNGLNTQDILEGVCTDPRIGNYYNNPSFGYGGYCLPKDTKQLLANYEGIPQDLIGAIVKSNETRKDHIANMIEAKEPSKVGIYRLAMKKDSDNFRKAAIIDVIKKLQEKGIDIIIYEPNLSLVEFNGCRVIENLEEFLSDSDIVIANRMDEQLEKVKQKVYTRDLYSKD
ncbi:MAG: nucleotide sugar dehydrogenase [Bacilli bacterium]|nr:nucleotide sugar dehydrogenase [Bacilli bacterium]